MAVPDRPVSGAPIESVWGQEIHDRTITPKGFRAHGSGTTLPSDHSTVTLDMSTADDDPGGWCDTANDRAVAPAGSDGEYSLTCRISCTNLDSADGIRAKVFINGTEVMRFNQDGETGQAVHTPLNIDLTITAGDIVTIRANRIGSTGAGNPSASITRLSLHRWGDEFGA